MTLDDSKRQQDPRAGEIIRHLRVLARRHDRVLVVQDYLEYRTRNAPQLPSMNAVYKIFGTWPEALEAAGVSDDGKRPDLSRTSNEALIDALRQAADFLDVKVLSSHAYDDYRRRHAPHLPSQAVIRKWLGRWADAVKLAGLETTERAAPRKATLAEIIDCLRRAKEQVNGMLTEDAYAQVLAALPEAERRTWPDVQHVLSHFPSWDVALRSADVEQSDELHPDALWTAEEARRIMRQVTRVLGHPPTQREYTMVSGKAQKPMPSWDVLTYLLSA